MGRPDISIVVPVYNEEENLPELHRRLKTVLEDVMQVSYEMIFVDDGSSDSSWEIVERFHKENHKCKGIKLSRNFGHHPALTAGIDGAEGGVCVVMDADLQARPEDIPQAFEQFEKGNDVVWAVAHAREDGLVAKCGAKLFYVLFNKVAGVKIPTNIVFLALSRRALDALGAYREKRRFLAGMFGNIGFRHETITVKKGERFAGEVKYSLRRRLVLASAGITAYSKIPLKMASYVGWLMSFCSIVFAVGTFMRKILFGSIVSGYASLIVAITFLAGVQLIMLGILGEYIGVVLDEVKDRPIYIVEKTLR
jgi:polyisoprenyl-phosphate glycosyltransferase